MKKQSEPRDDEIDYERHQPKQKPKNQIQYVCYRVHELSIQGKYSPNLQSGFLCLTREHNYIQVKYF
jgi:hypothetical protein